MSIVISAKQMKKLDSKTINEFGLPARILMENAGKGCADYLEAKYPKAITGHIVILHGTGNNSGDGFVISRWLHEAGHQVSLMQLHEGNFSPESLVNFELCKVLSIPARKWQDDPKLAAHLLYSASLIIDAVFGISFHGELPADVFAAFAICNSVKSLRIAIDIPSGVNADTGEAAPDTFQAHHTLAIHALKTGHILHAGKRSSGELHIIPIGIPELYHHELPCQELITQDNCCYPHRDFQAHKGSYGKVFVIGGSPGYTGSVALSCKAALRCGAGYVYLVSRKNLELSYNSISPEIMFRPIPHVSNYPPIDLESFTEFLAPASAILIGPGLGLDEYSLGVLELVLACAKVPVVIDADAITLLSQNPLLMKYLESDKVLITPHPGEFSRISGFSAEMMKKDTVATLREFCHKHSARVLLKGDTSIYCDTDHLKFNTAGNDGLATGGSGDVLGGIITAFVAGGMKIADAAINAAFLMGSTAEKLSLVRHTPSIIPSDIIENLFR